MTDFDFECAGFTLDTDGAWIIKSKDFLGHTRHASIYFDGSNWRCNGIGIAGPKNKEDLAIFVKIVFG